MCSCVYIDDDEEKVEESGNGVKGGDICGKK